MPLNENKYQREFLNKFQSSKKSEIDERVAWILPRSEVMSRTDILLAQIEATDRRIAALVYEEDIRIVEGKVRVTCKNPSRFLAYS
jgi:hypothetical protein